MDPYETYEDLYRKAKDAYLEENWAACVNYMLSALDDFKFYQSALVYCRLHCRNEDDSTVRLSKVENPDLKFYSKGVRETLCLLKCRQNRLGLRPNELVNPAIEEAFQNKVPYDYLQLCYYKVEKYQQAASAAYTFLAWNPGHEVMEYNFKFYITLEGVDFQQVRNLETKTFQELYLMGNEAYNKKKYHEVMHYFENALDEYFEAEEECRALCEGPFDKNGIQDFVISTANHFVYTLKCKQKCPQQLSFIYGEQYENYLSSHYHYLQFAYYKVGEIKKACVSVATYLLFHPDDKTMKRNQEFYLSLEGVDEGDFKPVDEIVEYLKRDMDEKTILIYIQENFKFGMDAVEEKQSEKLSSPSTVLTANTTKTKKIPKLKNREASAQNIIVIMDEKDLNGTQRFVADGFATPEECDDLLYLAQAAAVNGDGYDGKKSPHTRHESFQGLTTGRAAVLAKFGVVEVEKAQVLLDVSEKGREYVEKYFKLEQDLFFTYTHLVCRTALKDSKRIDLSHPVHADNCLLQPDGSCLKEKPAFTYRDYSAVIYLNEDFEGGKFIFAKNKKTIQAKVTPKCGRIVGFSAGFENLHGVQAITKGRRCALAMWFTLNHKYRETEREMAQKVLDQIYSTTKVEEEEKVNEGTSKGNEMQLLNTGVCSLWNYLIYGDVELVAKRQ